MRCFPFRPMLLSATITREFVLMAVAAAVLCAAARASRAVDTPIETPTAAYVTLMIARDPAVQAELRLQQPQIKEVEAAVAEIDQPMWRLRDASIDKGGKEVDALVAKFRERLQKVLSPEQIARLDQLILQARGFRALASSDMTARLKLADSQVTLLRELLAQAKPPQTVPADKVLAVLSPQQQSDLAAMAGLAFDFDRVSRIGCVAPELRGIDQWLNSEPLSLEKLRGKVVVVHFWAFGCINCVHNLPHYQAWHEKFSGSEVAILGLHTPETAAERSLDNLRANIAQREIKYPVAFDLAAENWKAWGNNVWPSVYLVDRQGRVRHWWYGELNFQEAKGEEAMRKNIENLVRER